jgi:S-adenosylmethionine:tRNA ribosyltransferase-isomerase
LQKKQNQVTDTFLRISDYDYPLADERIAKYPLAKRDESKLLIWQNTEIQENTFKNIADFLSENALLVYNNTKVIQARLIFEKITGAKIEIFCLEPLQPTDYALSLGSTSGCEWRCLVGNLKKWKNEDSLHKNLSINGLEIILAAKILETTANTHRILFSWNNENISFAEILENAGELPIPPYLHRKTEKSDLTTYQTVYSKIKGSVAAPTAGLHFTDDVLAKLPTKHIETEEVTLHVGAGTFQPVKTKNALEHTMHAETFSVKHTVIAHLKQKIGNIVAVGTTSVRTLESLYFIGCALAEKEKNANLDGLFRVSQWQPYTRDFSLSAEESLQVILDYLDENNLTELHAATQIMIKPNYKFRMVDVLITNFHQPKSTLLLLVSAFVGTENWHKIYDYALENNFRFLSYGDSSLLFRT